MVLSRRLSTAFLTLFVVVLTTAGLTFVVAGAAQAHSALVSSTPAEGDSISEIPTAIVLEFNEDIQDIGNEVVVLDPEGTPVANGEMVVDGPIVTQPIGVGAAGAYTVTWRVVSADGHPISGEFSYELRVPQTVETTEATTEASQETATDATTETSSSVAPSSSDAAADVDDDGSSPGAAAPIVIALAVLALAAVVVLVVRRRRAR